MHRDQNTDKKKTTSLLIQEANSTSVAYSQTVLALNKKCWAPCVSYPERHVSLPCDVMPTGNYLMQPGLYQPLLLLRT